MSIKEKNLQKYFWRKIKIDYKITNVNKQYNKH